MVQYNLSFALTQKKQKGKAVFAKPKKKLHFTKMKKLPRMLSGSNSFHFLTFRFISFFNGFPNKANSKTECLFAAELVYYLNALLVFQSLCF